VDAVITDPPYGTTACKWDSVIPFEPMWSELKRIIKPRGAIVLFGSQPFTSALVMSNPKWFRYEWVWEKTTATGFGNANKMPLKNHENIAVFYQALPTYQPQGLEEYDPKKRRGGPSGKAGAFMGRNGITPGRHHLQRVTNYPKTVLRFSREAGAHPTQKPLALLEYLVRTYTNEGDTVLDFTMGSGTTGAACGNLGRSFIGIEKDAGYFNVARERIEAAYDPLCRMAKQAA
jgi:site-specific DNA-methyltransferase (adenine-specific)